MEDNEVEDNNKEDNNNKDDNNDMGISALGLDRDLGFSRGHQGRQEHRLHDDDDDEEEEDDGVFVRTSRTSRASTS